MTTCDERTGALRPVRITLLVYDITALLQIVVIEEPVDNLNYILTVGIVHGFVNGQHGLCLERDVLAIVNRQLKIYPCADKLHHSILSVKEFLILDVAILVHTIRLRGFLLSVHIMQEGVTVVDDSIVVTGLVEAVVKERRLIGEIEVGNVLHIRSRVA